MVHFFRCPHRGSRLRESAAKQAPCGGRRPLSASLLWLSFLAGPSSAQNTAPSASPTSPAIAAAAQSYVFHQDRRGRITVPVCAQPEPGREPGVLWQPLPESSSWRNLQTDGSHGPRMAQDALDIESCSCSFRDFKFSRLSPPTYPRRLPCSAILSICYQEPLDTAHTVGDRCSSRFPQARLAFIQNQSELLQRTRPAHDRAITAERLDFQRMRTRSLAVRSEHG